MPNALTAGFHRALLTGSAFLLAAGLLALRSPNTHGEAEDHAGSDATLEPARV
jgi:hypothetical protein